MEAQPETLEVEPLDDEVVDALAEIATDEVELEVEDSGSGDDPYVPDDLCHTCYKLPGACKCKE